MHKFNELRQKHKKFIYHDYIAEKDSFTFHFSINDYHFYPKWEFSESYTEKLNNQALYENLVFNIGMSELVSYWKSSCSPIVEIRCGALDDYAISWWKKLYFYGLGEFFYKNEIVTDIDSFMQIVPTNSDMIDFTQSRSTSGAIVPIGGGKDSIVTLEMLNKFGDISENLCYMVKVKGTADRSSMLMSAKIAGYEENQVIKVSRTIDETLLKLNELGYLNGHTPISSVFAFSSYAFAVLMNKKYIILSNESSSNEGNSCFLDVNHQYSKSTEFERDFRDYTRRYFGSSTEYFSLLRPWSEWQITKEFVRYPQYFKDFRSCNVGSKSDSWCGKCSKCLYVYVMLSAFLSDERLIQIFGTNMYENKSLDFTLKSLTNPAYDKPFECVGTREEVRLALKTAVAIRKSSNLPLLLEKNFNEISSYEIINHDDFFDDENFVPQNFLKLFRKEVL